MKLLRRLSLTNKPAINSVLTIGNFDGVHVGHQALLLNVRFAAATINAPVSVLTFAPHPKEFFQPEQAPTRITTLRDKLMALKVLGVDHVYIANFNHSLASMSPQAFIDEILIKRIQPQKIIIGDDFKFGAKRQGDFKFLKQAGQLAGFTVEAMPTITINSDRASSTRIRQALSQGQLQEVQHLLNRPYRITGRILHGQKLGRILGFPTLNIAFKPGRPSLEGIFAVKVYGLGEKVIHGVASLGHRPTVEATGEIWLEVHLFDFHQDVYGKLASVEFVKKIRPILPFESLDALKTAISQDVDHAKQIFQNRS